MILVVKAFFIILSFVPHLSECISEVIFLLESYKNYVIKQCNSLYKMPIIRKNLYIFVGYLLLMPPNFTLL